VIHAQWGQSAILALPKKVPLVITHRGGDLEGIVDREGRITPQGRILRLLSQFVGLFADRVILVSESLSKYLWVKNYDILPVCLDAKLFIPMERNECRLKLGLELDKKYVLFPSDPERIEKRYELAKKACDLATDQPELIVLKNIPHDQMPIYMNAVDTLIITSKYEGSPTVVFEALACNLPIVSVDVGDVKFRIAGMEGCYLCEKDSPDDIAKGLDFVLKSNSRLSSSEKMQEFSSDKFAEKMIRVYQDVLGE